MELGVKSKGFEIIKALHQRRYVFNQLRSQRGISFFEIDVYIIVRAVDAHHLGPYEEENPFGRTHDTVNEVVSVVRSFDSQLPAIYNLLQRFALYVCFHHASSIARKTAYH